LRIKDLNKVKSRKSALLLSSSVGHESFIFDCNKVAISPTNMKIQANPAGLIEQLWLLAAQPDTYFQDDAQKKEFQRLSQDAFTAIEEPFETMQRLAVGVSVPNI
jgi:hypothetical protein